MTRRRRGCVDSIGRFGAADHRRDIRGLPRRFGQMNPIASVIQMLDNLTVKP